MKKTRFLSLFLALTMSLSLLCSGAQGAQAPAETIPAETASAETAPTSTASTSDETTPLTTQSDILGAYDDSDFEAIQGKAALLVDYNTQTILYQKNIADRLYPASITKVMTALLAIEAIESGQLALDQEITVGSYVNDGLSSDSSTQHIKDGEIITVENLLYCLLVASANEAANILAYTISGSIDGFVDQMNAKAAELGCTGTHFVNPHGLHDENHYTTAYDIYLMTAAAWQYDLFKELVGTDEYYVPATNLSEQRHFYNTNLLLSEKKTAGYSYDYCVGGKTGTTKAAGACLVSIAKYEGRLLFSVILGVEEGYDENGTPTHLLYTEARRLFRHGFLDFSTLTVVSASELITQVPVTLGADLDYVVLSPAQDVNLNLVYGLTAEDFERSISVPDSVQAPIQAGDVIGSMTVSYQGQQFATVDLVAVDSVTVSPVSYVQQKVVDFLTQPLVMLALIAVLLIIIILLIWRIFFHNPDKKARKKAAKHYQGSRNIGKRK